MHCQYPMANVSCNGSSACPTALAPHAEVAADAPLMDSGLDSLGAVELRSSLESKLAVQLPATLVFDYPTLSAMVGFLDSTIAGQQADTLAPAHGDGVVKSLRTMHQPAVLSEAGHSKLLVVSNTYSKFPAASAAVAAAAAAGSLNDVISVVPMERYDAEVQLTDDLPARFGGFLERVQVKVGTAGCGMYVP